MMNKIFLGIVVSFLGSVILLGNHSITSLKDEPKCPKGMVFSECTGPSVDCLENCEGSQEVCGLACYPGCVCKAGLVYSTTKKRCVVREKCERIIKRLAAIPRCKNGMEFTECGSMCPPTCSNPSPEACVKGCFRGCQCKLGTVLRESDGTCVPEQECTDDNDDDHGNDEECKGDFVFSECGSSCPMTCDHVRKNETIFCDLKCEKGCFCPQGLVLSDDKEKCVKPESCITPSIVCPPGMSFSETVYPCQPDCEHLDAPLYCKGAPRPGCICPEGTVINRISGLRNGNICVKPKDCPKSPDCPGNLVRLNCTQESLKCQASCDNEKPACEDACEKGCGCPKGRVLASSALPWCIPAQNCPKPPTCRENFEWKECGSLCPKTCLNSTTQCAKQCVSGCFCKEGFILNKDGKCIKPEQCPVECADKPKFNQCFLECRKKCASSTSSGSFPGSPVFCLSECMKSSGCCDLKPFQNSTSCSSPGSESFCGLDQNLLCKAKGMVYNSCGTACPKTCQDMSDKPCSDQCVEGCFCPEGTVLDEKTNTCVPPSRCIPKDPICPDNKVFNECGTACPLTCDNFNSTIQCTEQCVSGCFCKEGFILNKDGKCIKPEQCPVECADKPKFDTCIIECRKECAKPPSPFATSPFVCLNECIKKAACCDLKPQYDYDLKECVPFAKDHFICGSLSLAEKCKAAGMIYSECGTACPLTCKNYKNPKNFCVSVCISGCQCPSGTVKDESSGTCVSPEACPAV